MIRATLVAICWLKIDWTKASNTVGGLADLEAVELFNQGGEDGVLVGVGVELGQVRVAAKNPG